MSEEHSDWEEFKVEDYRSQLLSYFLHNVKDLNLAEDLTQETILACIQADVKGDPRTFLFSVAFKKAKNHWREKYKSPEVKELFDTAESDCLDNSRRRELIFSRHCLNLLRVHFKPEDVALISMRYYEQMTFKDIALELGCSVGTAFDRHERILKQLRLLVQKHPPRQFEEEHHNG